MMLVKQMDFQNCLPAVAAILAAGAGGDWGGEFDGKHWKNGGGGGGLGGWGGIVADLLRWRKTV